MESLQPSPELSFTVPWGIIQAKCWGSPSGKPFLGLHGWLDNANTFDKLAPLLPNDIYLVAIDLPGHGRSSCRPPGVPFTFFDWIIDVKRIVSQLNWKKFSLIGHSMGAGVAALYAGAFNSEVDNVILLECRGPFVVSYEDASKVLANCATHLAQCNDSTSDFYKVFSSQEDLVTKLVHRNPELTEESARILTARNIKTDGKVVLISDPRLRAAPVGDVQGNVCVTSQSLIISILSKVKCRVLVIQGTNSHPVFRIQHNFVEERFQILQSNAKYYKYYEVPGNHCVHLNNPQLLAREIKFFLSPAIKCKL